MKERDITRLEAFLERVKAQTYPEPPSELHSEITARMIDHLFATVALPPDARVLDVGCGQGVAMEQFRRRGSRPVGITLNAEDARVCREAGYDVLEMDQSFLDFDDGSFDLVWCRHCLEHSIFPFFTLSELSRVLLPGGHLYVEVPAPDTSSAHQANPNHYSVLGKSMWLNLLQRTGFRALESLDVDFSTAAGPDRYWAFISRKPG
ncbi:MAG: class I SAM-dependent methyltransferase [Chloroflexota bacterium]